MEENEQNPRSKMGWGKLTVGFRLQVMAAVTAKKLRLDRRGLTTATRPCHLWAICSRDIHCVWLIAPRQLVVEAS